MTWVWVGLGILTAQAGCGGGAFDACAGDCSPGGDADTGLRDASIMTVPTGPPDAGASGRDATSDGASDGGSNSDDDSSIASDAGGPLDSSACGADGGSWCGSDAGCVDTTGDVDHCGSCTNVCAAPTSNGHATCAAHQCGVACDGSYHVCNGQCLADGAPPAVDPCAVTEAFGIFVAPTGKDTGAGTRAAPVATIAKGVELAAKRASKRVYVCSATYAAPLVIGTAGDGVSVYGGFACPTGVAGDWAYQSGTTAMIAPTAPGVALTITSVIAGASLTDVEVDAKDGAAASDSSLAALVSGSQNVTFTRVVIRAGNGGKGDSGTTAANFAAPSATSGGSAKDRTGADVVVCTCANTDFSTGGGGGNGSFATPLPGGPGTLDLGGQPPYDGKAGAPQTTVPPSPCTNGDPGASGGDGDGGVATPITMAISAGGLACSGGVGGDGLFGTTAQGGGGGGGGLYTSVSAGGGGAGGCGGCGGGAGSGGHPGGSSVALASVGSFVTLNACHLVAGKGGDGGKGADGQSGQAGGERGQASGNGCAGGQGGTGGHGGGGAGGAGGNAIAIAYTSGAPTVSSDTVLSEVGGGAGGASGSPNGVRGSDGTTSAKLGL